MKTYLVGGAVRDALLGLPVKDRDWVVVGATPEQLMRQGFLPVGKDFPVFLHPRTKEEYALARTERKTAPGYHGFAIHAAPDVTLEDDLARRDLTVNAIAQASNGDIVDPFGGRQDLADKVFRHVTHAFREDPVRILRVARLAARFADFTVAPDTLALMRDMVQCGEVDHLVAERVWQELAKGLQEATPSRLLQVLRDCGALARLLPEVDALWGVPQRTEFPPGLTTCTGTHTALALDYAARQGLGLAVRFAVLLHGVDQGQVAVESVCARFRVPSECRDLAVLTTRFQALAHQAMALDADHIVQLLKQTDALRRPQRFKEFLQACEAGARAHAGAAPAPYPQTERLQRSLAAALTVDAGAIAATATQQALIPEKIHAARVAAVQAALVD